MSTTPGARFAFGQEPLVLSKGAREVVTCALTQKPWAPRGEDGVDFPAAFPISPRAATLSHGMDDAGK